ncbi:MAG: type II secretion system protein [Candidatus Theseobacter exili]|nr:type II secretion system protein [Candidatus Theseobacter exili]
MKRLIVKKSGLTVLEMLAVIAIITILVSIFFPTIYRTRQMAKSAVCIGRLKQIGMAFRMYTESDPYNRMPGWGGSSAEFWRLMPLLAPYIGTNGFAAYRAGKQEVFRCPANQSDTNLGDRQDSYGNQIDYEYNGFINGLVVKNKIASPQ